MDVSRMDPASAKLAVELQLSDINNILSEIDGSRNTADQRTGFETMKTDLEGQLQLLETKVLALNLLRAEHDSRVAFSKLLKEEKQAVNDHKLAMSLHGLKVNDPDVKSAAEYEASLCNEENCHADVEWDRAKELNTAGFSRGAADLTSPVDVDSEDISDAGGSEDGSEESDRESESIDTCCVCLETDPTEDLFELFCDHIYCRACLTDHFKTALVDTGLFPPRCCKVAIPIEICRDFLPNEVVKKFDLKVEELAHPNPTYCCNAECAKFIRAKDIKDDVGTCVFCKNYTCVLCKGEEHDGLCPKDPHVVLLMDAAKRSRWQQCSHCKNMVELSIGCFHMTCRCSHQFCYLCGVKWKECGCPQADVNYLTRPGPALDAVQPAAQVAEPARAPGPALQNLNRAVARLCDHHWTRNDIRGVCQGCAADWLPYLFRCGGCNRLSCWRCINDHD